MDKETLSNYGWIVTCVLVLAVMIALATPFGNFVKDAVARTTEGLYATQQKALETVGILTPITYLGDEPSPFQKEFDELTAGKSAPVSFCYGDYRYIKADRGWEVELNTVFSGVEPTVGCDIVATDRLQTSYGEILSHAFGFGVQSLCAGYREELMDAHGYTNINDTYIMYPVDGTGLFQGCTNLVVAPAIPKGVRNMSAAFDGCSSLTTAPVIPNSVENLFVTFHKCGNLVTYTGSKDANGDFSHYVIPGNVTNMMGTFDSCTSMVVSPDLTHVSKLESMMITFRYCSSLVSVSKIPSKVKYASGFIAGCTSLVTAPDMTGATAVESLFMAFQHSSLVTGPDLSNCSNLKTMEMAFNDCDSLSDGSTVILPTSVSELNMQGAFQDCSSLTIAPEIPSSVTNMCGTFSGCSSLSGTVVINANPTIYDDCFYECNMSQITLAGSSTMLEELRDTAHEYIIAP